MLQPLILFVHVAAAMGIVAGLGIEGLVLLQLGRARVAEELRAALDSFRYVQRVGAASLIATVVSGIYLATVFWHWQGPWIGTAFMLLVVIAVIGASMTGRGIAALGRAAAAPSVVLRLDVERSKPLLQASFTMRLSLVLGIVFLMTVKPDLKLSLLVAAVATAAGLVLGLPGLLGGSGHREQT
ncbi:MAG TPA: hypothetical protein VGG78_03755 [Gemmatimonadaceae bacterium]